MDADPDAQRGRDHDPDPMDQSWWVDREDAGIFGYEGEGPFTSRTAENSAGRGRAGETNIPEIRLIWLAKSGSFLPPIARRENLAEATFQPLVSFQDKTQRVGMWCEMYFNSCNNNRFSYSKESCRVWGVSRGEGYMC